MTTATRPGLNVVVAELAALKTQLRRIYVKWCVSGPTLEASSALAAMAQEEAGHARVLARLAGDADPLVDAERLVAADAVADWPTLVGHAGPVEVALAAVTAGLRGVSDPGFQRNIGKIAVEERYHADFFVGCFKELDGLDDPAGELFRKSRHETEGRVDAWLGSSTELLAGLGVELRDEPNPGSVLDVPCVHCGSIDTRLLSAFGGSLMTSLIRCNSCGAQFEAIRWR